MSFTFIPPSQKSPILHFDEHELATLIRGTLSSEVSKLASEFVLALKISGSQFMHLDDDKLHTLANNNPDALYMLRTLRQSPPEYIVALISTNRRSPAIPPDFRHMALLNKSRTFEEANVDGSMTHSQPVESSDHEGMAYEWLNFEDENLIPTSIKETSIIWSSEKPPENDKSIQTQTVHSSGANNPFMPLNTEVLVTWQPTSSVISAHETSSTSRNTSESESLIRNEISAGGWIAYDYRDVRHSNDDAQRSGQVPPSSGGIQHICDSLSADLVFLSPFLVKNTLKSLENHNVISTAPTPSAFISPADGGGNDEEQLSAPTSSCMNENNHIDYRPIGREPRMTSPTKRGGYGTFSGQRPCLMDHGQSPNLRSLASDHGVSILPQISLSNDAGPTYGIDTDEILDSGVPEKVPSPYSGHRDFQSSVGFTAQDMNLQVEQSSSPNFAPHNVAFGGDLLTTILSGTLITCPGSPATFTHSEHSSHSPSENSSLARSIAGDKPNLRYRDVEKPIKLPVHDDSSAYPSSKASLATAVIPSSTWLSLREDGQRSHICASSSPPKLPDTFESPLVSRLQTLVNANNQQTLSLDEEQFSCFSLACPHPMVATAPERHAEKDYSAISDTSASSAPNVIIQPDESFLMTPNYGHATPSHEDNPSFSDHENSVCALALRGSLPECHQSSMFLPADNSGYLASNIDSQLNGPPPPGTVAQNMFALNSDTCPVLEDGAKHAHYSQPKVDIGIVPELRLAINDNVFPEHVETFREPSSDIEPAADWTARDDAQESKFSILKTHSKINEISLPRILLSPPFSQELSSSLDSLSLDRPAILFQTTADPTPVPTPQRSLCSASRVMHRTLWPVSDDFPGESQTPITPHGKARSMKRGTQPLFVSSLNEIKAGKAKSVTPLSYADAATQTELACQRSLLKIQADDQRRELPIKSSTLLPTTPSFLGGVHKILAAIIPKVGTNDTPDSLPATNPRPRVDVTSRGLLPSSQGPMSALSKDGDI